jgi:hypothetical protein
VADMEEKVLEFRGIHIDHLKMYLEEIGGKRLSDSFPYQFQGDRWGASILKEQEISFTAAFKVNAVFIRFKAEDEKILEDVLKKYRLKTFRAGG